MRNLQPHLAQLEPLPEGWYRPSALVAPRIELTGDWFILGADLATDEVGATASVAWEGEWLILSYRGDAEVCQDGCITLSATVSDEVAFRTDQPTDQVVITNTSELFLERLVVLSGERANIAYVPYVMAPTTPSVEVGGGVVTLTMTSGDVLMSMLLMASLVLLGAMLAVGVYRWK